MRSDEVTVDEALGAHPDGILLSPGPGVPEKAGICGRPAHRRRRPGAGARGLPGPPGDRGGVRRSRGPRSRAAARQDQRGRATTAQGVLAGLPSPFTATRYHSLVVAEDDLPDVLEVTARTAAGLVMAMRHRELPVEGVQFHPESVLTQGGHLMLANWLAVCGDADAPEPGPGAGRPCRGAPAGRRGRGRGRPALACERTTPARARAELSVQFPVVICRHGPAMTASTSGAITTGLTWRSTPPWLTRSSCGTGSR